MRRLNQKLLLLSLFWVFSGPSNSQDGSSFNDERESTPAVTVQVVSDVVDAGGLGQGELEATFQFQVEANADKVNLSCLVSDLNLRKNVIKPIGVKTDSSRGCRIEVAGAYSIAGKSSELVEFKNERHTIDGSLDAVKSDYVTFRTLDATNFRHHVFVTVSWFRSSESKPVGNYEGLVKLIAEIPNNIYPAK